LEVALDDGKTPQVPQILTLSIAKSKSLEICLFFQFIEMIENRFLVEEAYQWLFRIMK